MITDFRIKVFQTVATRLSFTQAARELFISQPAVTKHINELEKSVGRPLFNRHGPRISLTAEGTLMLGFANKMMALYEQMDEAIGKFRDTVSGQLHIGASTTVAQYVLPEILARFKAAYPQIRVTLLSDNSDHIENLVTDKRIDIGIIEGNALNPLLHYEPFLKDEIVLATRGDNGKIKSAEIKTDRIARLPLAVRETGSGTRDVVEKALEKNHLRRSDLQIEIALGSSESLKNYLLHSDCYAFLSIHAIIEEMHQHKLKIIEVTDLDITRTFRFVCLHGLHSAVVSRFKHFCLLHDHPKE
ncbi:MAG TPA: LysR family transcriptional regulator [Chitinophagaceae bacterium]|nr:LysR family transcriptional regulator [Chitinophagaceae bacterium]